MRYLLDTSVTQPNRASQFIMRACNTDFNRANAGLQNDLRDILGGNCVYLPHFIAPDSDYSLYDALESELLDHSQNEADVDYVPMVQWSKHMKHENPAFSPTFQRVVETLSAYFEVDIYATRLNYYPDGTQWKPFHRDSHAYAKDDNGKKQKEDFTIGISFGAQRSLAFLHEESQVKFLFPQQNGDCFAFSSEVNDAFLHGVPKASETIGKRFSIIAWGRRRQKNLRNSAPVVNKKTSGHQHYDQAMADIMNKVQRARIGNSTENLYEGLQANLQEQDDLTKRVGRTVRKGRLQ